MSEIDRWNERKDGNKHEIYVETYKSEYSALFDHFEALMLK